MELFFVFEPRPPKKFALLGNQSRVIRHRERKGGKERGGEERDREGGGEGEREMGGERMRLPH